MQEDIYSASHVIDGDFATRWSSPASDPQYVVIDFGGRTRVSGVVLYWETAFSSAYAIEVSENGTDWTQVYAEGNGDGRTDYVFFPSVETSFLRLFMTKRGTGWGHSLWEMVVLSADQAWNICAPPALDASALIDGISETTLCVPGSTNLILDLGSAFELSGIRIDWGERFAREVRLLYSLDGESWCASAELLDGAGRFDSLLSDPFKARYLKLEIAKISGDAPAVDIAGITLRGPAEVLTDFTRYAMAAQKAPVGYYPLQLLGKQVYWTIFGIPDDSKEALLDEYGNVEISNHGSVLMPYIFAGGKLGSAVDGQQLGQYLVDDCLPVPSVGWRDGDLQVIVSAQGWGRPDDAGAFLRYSLSNHSLLTQTGTLYLAVRPLQINPVWQHGGLSWIDSLSMSNIGSYSSVQINGQNQYILMTSPNRFGVCEFERGDVVRFIQKDEVPGLQQISNETHLNSGALAYDFVLEPGAHTNVYVAAPLNLNPQVVGRFKGSCSSLDEAWAKNGAEMNAMWDMLVNRTPLQLPDAVVEQTVRSQIAYILLNRDGAAIQPGSRHYERSWIRDGAMTCAALLRWGHADEVRAFIVWYSHFLTPEGMVPPSFRADDPLDAGPGSGIEWDGQGAYISLVMDYYRFTRDRTFLSDHFSKIVGSMRYLEQLRNQTLKEDYMAGEEGRTRFVGILPKSFSHEGYYPEMHSYWDDFWALKGWEDGAEAARILEDGEVAQWADEQYSLLADSVSKSIRATIEHKQIGHVPGCAEKGDFDPTSTSIVFFPCVSSAEILPRGELLAMYDRYFNELETRMLPEWNAAYTPYEVRNIMAFISLGQYERAHVLLKQLLADRRPAAWNHWAEVVLRDERMGCYIGDMPHTWAGSGFLNTVALMLAKEKNGALVLLEGIPDQWLDGEGIYLQHRPTWYGELELIAVRVDGELQVAVKGDVAPPNGFRIWIPKADRSGSIRVNGKNCAIDPDGFVVLPPPS